MLSGKEGINLPRYPSLPGRMRAKKAVIEEFEPSAHASAVVKEGLRVPSDRVSGPRYWAPASTPYRRYWPCSKGAAVLRRSASVLCLIETDGDAVIEASLRALSFAETLARSSNARLIAAHVGEISGTTLATLGFLRG